MTSTTAAIYNFVTLYKDARFDLDESITQFD